MWAVGSGLSLEFTPPTRGINIGLDAHSSTPGGLRGDLILTCWVQYESRRYRCPVNAEVKSNCLTVMNRFCSLGGVFVDPKTSLYCYISHVCSLFNVSLFFCCFFLCDEFPFASPMESGVLFQGYLWHSWLCHIQCLPVPSPSIPTCVIGWDWK